MKIEFAKHSGFCMGVRNAILKIVNKMNLSNEDLYVYGPLIHNPQTIDVLNKRGLKTINNLEDIENKQVVIRTHGIPTNDNKKLKNKTSKILNLTCPRVSRVQSIIKKYSNNGYFTLIIGDKNHAEVVGLKSYASSGFNIISEIKDIDNIKQEQKYLVVCQTTLDRDFFEKVIKILSKIFKDVIVIDTICDSTRYRQNDVLEGIKRGIDCLVVVGGKNSANTTRLAQIGKDHNIKTLHVETEDEINERDFKESKYVLVTAGASTPGWIINNVLEKLYNVKFQKTNIIINSIKKLLEFLARTNLLSSFTALFFSLAVQDYLKINKNFGYSSIAFLFIFSMYSINNYFDKNFLKACNSYKYQIYKRFGIPLLVLSIISLVASIFISIQFNIGTIILLILSYIFGLFYSTNLIKRTLIRLDILFIRKIYNTKIVTLFGWLIIVVGIPFINNKMLISDIISISIFLVTFTFYRHFLIDLIAFQGDLIFGRETLPIMVGMNRINFSFNLFLLSPMIFFIINSIMSDNIIYLIFLINIIYFLLLLKRLKKVNYLISLKYELLVDFNYILFIILYLLFHPFFF